MPQSSTLQFLFWVTVVEFTHKKKKKYCHYKECSWLMCWKFILLPFQNLNKYFLKIINWNCFLLYMNFLFKSFAIFTSSLQKANFIVYNFHYYGSESDKDFLHRYPFLYALSTVCHCLIKSTCLPAFLACSEFQCMWLSNISFYLKFDCSTLKAGK